MNIRQNLGEAVPTVIFQQIAHKIRKILSTLEFTEQDAKHIIEKFGLTDHDKLLDYIDKNPCRKFSDLSKIAEMANAQSLLLQRNIFCEPAFYSSSAYIIM